MNWPWSKTNPTTKTDDFLAIVEDYATKWEVSLDQALARCAQEYPDQYANYRRRGREIRPMNTRLPTGVHRGRVTSVREVDGAVEVTFTIPRFKRDYIHTITYEEYVRLLDRDTPRSISRLQGRTGYLKVFTSEDFPETGTRVVKFWIV